MLTESCQMSEDTRELGLDRGMQYRGKPILFQFSDTPLCGNVPIQLMTPVSTASPNSRDARTDGGEAVRCSAWVGPFHPHATVSTILPRMCPRAARSCA
jgi:hypothetical protein